MKTIAYSKEATKALRRMPANVSARIVAKIDQYAADPVSLVANVTALKGEDDVFRLRVADWRIVFIESALTIDIIRIAPRGSVYD